MKIAITGCQVHDSYGSNLSENFTKIINEKNRIPVESTFKDFKGFKLAQSIVGDFLKDENEIPDIFKYGVDTANRALIQSGATEDRDKIGVFASSLFTDADTFLRSSSMYSSGRSRSRPYDLFYQTPEPLATITSRLLHLGGMTSGISATCSSGLFSIEIASALLLQNVLDQAVIICSDISSNGFNSYKMHGTRALSSKNISRPFDKSRDGIIMGDGIAAIVIEKLETAERRGVKPLAIIEGIGSATANYHPTNPKSMSSAYYSAFYKAISTIDSIEKIQWISAHATSTIDGDLTENQIMSDLLPNRYITSFKGHLGHAMAASGLLELCYTIESMNNNLVPHIANTYDVDNISTRIAIENISCEAEYVIKNSYGFGGRASSIIISKGK